MGICRARLTNCPGALTMSECYVKQVSFKKFLESIGVSSELNAKGSYIITRRLYIKPRSHCPTRLNSTQCERSYYPTRLNSTRLKIASFLPVAEF